MQFLCLGLWTLDLAGFRGRGRLEKAGAIRVHMAACAYSTRLFLGLLWRRDVFQLKVSVPRVYGQCRYPVRRTLANQVSESRLIGSSRDDLRDLTDLPVCLRNAQPDEGRSSPTERQGEGEVAHHHSTDQ